LLKGKKLFKRGREKATPKESDLCNEREGGKEE